MNEWSVHKPTETFSQLVKCVDTSL